ncbi:MAG: phenylalanine--tRNA ligase subunit alpha [Clostridiales bacterium]|nr:phenylalanine--tRNA ligase subunit alpha [Clostridiales bacterium]
MKEQLEDITRSFLEKIKSAQSLKELEDLRLAALGKKGAFKSVLKIMGGLNEQERPEAGKLANDARSLIESALTEAKTVLGQSELTNRLLNEEIDVTISAPSRPLGGRHPITLVTDDLKDIFIGMGYEIMEGPDIETDYYNFAALNIPENHPAKDEQDTFYLDGGFLLRTQTSPVQIRAMETKPLPIRIIAPGRVYRADQVDATHSPVFHQLEGLVIDEDITFGDLKGSLETFARELFGKSAKARFRPHHFPFTEPSAEMDATCFACGGEGCRVCKDSGWIELLGCGMVHPKVLKTSGIDPEKYIGFAFGLGLDRIAMLKYGVSDLRLMYENDVNFLKQF